MSLRILVAGGCHVIGYPIGEEHSFVHIIEDRLDDCGIGAEIETLPYLPVKHVSRLVDAIRFTKPDITVLQLGNFETTVTFRQYVRRKLGMSKEKVSSARIQLPPNAIFEPAWAWQMKCTAKLLADTMLGQNMVDLASLDTAFAEMLGAIAAEAPGEVIVLSPLPCADPLYMRYRDRVAEILRRLSDNHGFLFLRSPLGSGNHEQYFVDPTHLNALGHDVVGQAVAEAISNVCRGVTDNLAFQS